MRRYRRIILGQVRRLRWVILEGEEIEGFILEGEEIEWGERGHIGG